MSSTTTAVPKLENGTAITFPSGDDVGALVVDLGSLYIQAGNAGDEWPKHFSESFVGVAVDNAATHSEDILMNSEENGSVYTKKKPYKHPLHKYPLFFSVLNEHTQVRPCLYRQSKRQLNSEALELEEVLSPVEPLQLDREVFETIIDRIFNSHEGLNVEVKGKPVLLTEPNVHNRPVREGMAEVLFETFEAQAVYTGKRAALTAFSVARTGGLFIDLGSATTTITPVIDGYTLHKNVKEFPIGGDLLDYQLNYLLKIMNLEESMVPIFSVKKHIKFAPNVPPIIESVEQRSMANCHPSYYYQGKRTVLRLMKESVCRISDEPLPAPIFNTISFGLPKFSSTSGVTKYELPDGTPVNTEQISRTVPECLFNFSWILGHHLGHSTTSSYLPPSLSGLKSIPHAAAQCVLECDVDHRRDLLHALTFTGGCSLLSGFGERVLRQFQDVEGLFGNGLKYKVICPQSTVERRYSSWIGGSILASLGSFQQMWMSQSEYDEHGASLLQRRCVQ